MTMNPLEQGGTEGAQLGQENTQQDSQQFQGPISEQPTLPTSPKPTEPAPGSQPNVNQAVAQAPASDPSMPVATIIAKAISLGLASLPATPAGWAKLVDFYSTPAGENQVSNDAEKGVSITGSQPPPGAMPGATSGTTSAAGPGPAGITAFLAAIRGHESGGNYTAVNPAGAYGAYQFIDSTWKSEATAAGYGQYANEHASAAPPSVQDAVASFMATNYFNKYGKWDLTAEAWYDPALVGQNVVPAPGAGNTETVTAYGADILKRMGQVASVDPTHPAAGAPDKIVTIAQSQLGIPYQWGGESPGKDFDCSGLVQWVYKEGGVALPRTAQQQYDATAKVSANTPLQPGDLLFFGSGAKGITHVGIYIGNNQMIDAPHTGADVRIDANPQGWADYVGATRPGDPSGSTTMMTSINAVTPGAQNMGKLLEQVLAGLKGVPGFGPAAPPPVPPMTAQPAPVPANA